MQTIVRLLRRIMNGTLGSQGASTDAAMPTLFKVSTLFEPGTHRWLRVFVETIQAVVAVAVALSDMFAVSVYPKSDL